MTRLLKFGKFLQPGRVVCTAFVQPEVIVWSYRRVFLFFSGTAIRLKAPISSTTTGTILANPSGDLDTVPPPCSARDIPHTVPQVLDYTYTAAILPEKNVAKQHRSPPPTPPLLSGSCQKKKCQTHRPLFAPPLPLHADPIPSWG